MLQGSETWSLKRENELALHWAKMRVISNNNNKAFIIKLSVASCYKV